MITMPCENTILALIENNTVNGVL